VVASPLGLAKPLSVVVVPVVSVGAEVVTVGGIAGVVNDSTAPNEVP
jgi:hypothetical protein